MQGNLSLDSFSAKINSIIALTAKVSPSMIDVGTIISTDIQNEKLQANKSSFGKAINIASSVPEITSFITENNVSKFYASLYYDVWIVEFYAKKCPKTT